MPAPKPPLAPVERLRAILLQDHAYEPATLADLALLAGLVEEAEAALVLSVYDTGTGMPSRIPMLDVLRKIDEARRA